MRLIDYFDRGSDLHPDRRCLHNGTRGWVEQAMWKKVLKKILREPCWASHDRKI